MQIVDLNLVDRASGQVPVVALQTMADLLDGARGTVDAKWSCGKELGSKNLVEPDDVVDVGVGQEKPADSEDCGNGQSG